MPKIVDHEARRKELAEAAWRVIRREGLEGASVRNVAKEAGMSLGSLRHYFATQSELLAFSMRMVGERVKERIKKLEMTGDIRADFERIIEETLPLDDERVSESIVWLGFVGKALVDESLGELAAEIHEALYGLFRKLADALIRFGSCRPDADAELEARRLHALVDGLVVHALTNPRSVDPDTIRRTIAYHLSGLMPERSDAQDKRPGNDRSGI